MLAEIVSVEALKTYKNGMGRIVCTSGGFDPVHPGHISTFVESKKLGDTLIVIVNGDQFLIRKKGCFFMDLETRCKIISAIKGVDYVIPYETPDDLTVKKVLSELKPHVFTKGGDRTDKSTIPEWELCKRLNIEIVTHVGMEPQWSSSKLLKDWTCKAADQTF